MDNKELLKLALTNAAEESLKEPLTVFHVYYVSSINEYTVMRESGVSKFLEVEGKRNPQLIAKAANGKILKV